MESPINYGRSTTRSPNLSSSPEHAYRHHHRSQYGSALASISSPTSGFHPYMPPTSRASPSTSGALSPPMVNDLHRYRNSYKTIGSPGSSVGGAAYSSTTSGSPSSYSARYSPSTYAQLSPPPTSSTSQQSKSTGSPYNVGSFLQNASLSSTSSRYRDVSPPRSSSTSALGSRTIPKKTASIRQQYDSPNSDKYSYAPSRSSSANDNSPPSTRSEPSPQTTRRTLLDAISADQSPKSGSQRSQSPSEVLRRQFEKEYSRAAEPTMMPSVPSSADGMPPPSPHHPYYGLYPAAAGMAAYYYHQMAYSAAAAYRNSMSWMHHPYALPPHQASNVKLPDTLPYHLPITNEQIFRTLNGDGDEERMMRDLTGNVPTSRGLLSSLPDDASHLSNANYASAYKHTRPPHHAFDSTTSNSNNNIATPAWNAHPLHHHVNDAQPIALVKEDSTAG